MTCTLKNKVIRSESKSWSAIYNKNVKYTKRKFLSWEDKNKEKKIMSQTRKIWTNSTTKKDTT
jgi:hypothetical protein